MLGNGRYEASGMGKNAYARNGVEKVKKLRTDTDVSAEKRDSKALTCTQWTLFFP